MATGSRPRRLALLEGFVNTHTLRTLDDAHALRAALADGGRLVIVGAGFIGQEVAAAVARAGVQATIVEAADAPLQAQLGPEVGAWFAELHRSQGVEVLLGAEITAAHGARRVEALTPRDGRRLACDHVVVGVGVDPAARDFTITFSHAGAPVAVLLVGRPHELPNARALLAA